MTKKLLFLLIFLNFNFLSATVIYIVKTKAANVREKPSINAKVIEVLSQYEEVKVIQFYGKWVKVKTLSGKIGWINKTVVEKVEDEEVEDEEIKTESQKVSTYNIVQQAPVAVTSVVQQPSTSIASIAGTSNITTSVETKPEPQIKGYKIDNRKEERRRIIGDHTFPTTVLFPTPIPTARFGFSQGFSSLSGRYINYYIDDSQEENCIPSDDEGEEFICFFISETNWGGLNEKFDSGIIINDYLSIDLSASINIKGGMDKKDFTSLSVNPEGVIKIGPSFIAYKGDNNLLLTLATRLTYARGINISAQTAIQNFFDSVGYAIVEAIENDPNFKYPPESIEDFFGIINSTHITSGLLGDAVKSFTGSLVTNESAFGISPSIGLVYPISDYLGVQSLIEYNRLKEKSKTKAGGIETETSSFINYGLGVSLDFRHLINFPLGSILEFSKDNYWDETKFGLGFYYQGIGDVQLGLFISHGKISNDWFDFKMTSGMFNITYFF